MGSSLQLRHPTLGCCLLVGTTALLGAPAAAVPGDCGCAEPAEIVYLSVVVRDFKEHSVDGGHPDFEITPSGGVGVYSGNVDTFIRNFKPAFVGGGKKVLNAATDQLGHTIAPHIANHRYMPGVDAPPQATSVILKDSDGVDAFEITYLSAEFNTDNTSTWTYHVKEIPGGKDLSHWNLVLDPSHQVMPGTTAGYDLGVDGSTGFYGIKWDVTDDFSEGTFVIVLDKHYLGADASCSVLAKGGNAPDTGDLFAPTGTVSTTGSPFNGGGALVAVEMGDTEADLGVSSSGGVQSATTFKQWYLDQPGTNLSQIVSLPLIKQDDCSYVFDDQLDPEYIGIGGFFPIDGELYGNSGGFPEHNYHFTLEFHAEFVYDSGADLYLQFTGDDDVWAFIDGKLAIDLGGVHDSSSQYVDLDRMGLVNGTTYQLDFFFAERHRVNSHFRIDTNLCLESVEIPTITASFD